MAFVLNRAYEKATCVLKEDGFDLYFYLCEKIKEKRRFF